MSKFNTYNMSPEHVSHLSRHPLPFKWGYTSSLVPGLINLEHFTILNPSDTYYFRTKAFARFQDIVTAFLGEVDIHVDYFFVPLQMLYTPFGQVFAQTPDFVSDMFDDLDVTTKSEFPLCDVNASIHAVNAEDSPIYRQESNGVSMMRFLDQCNLNPLNVLRDTEEEDSTVTSGMPWYNCWNPKITPWIPAAYQAVYQKYFRNDNIEPLRVRNYNFDSEYLATSALQAFSRPEFFQMRTVQRSRDYFTNIQVSPITTSLVNGNSSDANAHNVSDGGIPNSQLTKINQFLGVETDYLQGDIYDGSAPSVLSNNGTTSSVPPDYPVNTTNIRTLFAIDKFLRIYGRAGKTYDDQILAHFGYKVPHDVKHDITHVKHYRFSLTADPVEATATVADGSSLGQIGGQGSNSFDSGDNEKFTAPVHGVFLCTCYAVTKPRYQYTFNKLHLLTNRLSFPIPEFDKLGQQPMYAFQVNPVFFNRTSKISSLNNLGPFNGSERIGWERRYAEFKDSYNRSSLAYVTRQPYNNSGDDPFFVTNAFSPWVLTRDAFFMHAYMRNTFGSGNVPNWNNYLPVSVFYEQQDALNNVMKVEYSPDWSNDYVNTPWLAFQRDPIIFEFMCEGKRVSWMSPTGEPDL